MTGCENQDLHHGRVETPQCIQTVPFGWTASFHMHYLGYQLLWVIFKTTSETAIYFAFWDEGQSRSPRKGALRCQLYISSIFEGAVQIL